MLLAAASIAAPSIAADPPPLLARMAGTWDVEQRMWTSAKGEPVVLPRAIAERRLVRETYLEEVMRPAEDPADPAARFTRQAFVNRNAVTSQYEYSSIDTRAPQLMVERGPASAPEGADLQLQGGSFVAPEWGPAKNVKFAYRLTLGEVRDDRQTVRLFLSPQSVLPKGEFLAFEYVYSKRH